MQLQRLIGDLETYVGAEAFCHGAQHGGIGILAVERRRRAPHKGPRRLQFGRHVGKTKLQRLEFVEALPKALRSFILANDLVNAEFAAANQPGPVMVPSASKPAIADLE